MLNSGIKMRPFLCKVADRGFWRPVHKQPTQEQSSNSQERVVLFRLSGRTLMDKDCLSTSELGEHIRPDPEEYKVTLALIRSATSACKKGAGLEEAVKNLTTYLQQLVLVETAPRHCLHVMDSAFDALLEVMRQKGLNEDVQWWKELMPLYFEAFELH